MIAYNRKTIEGVVVGYGFSGVFKFYQLEGSIVGVVNNCKGEEVKDDISVEILHLLNNQPRISSCASCWVPGRHQGQALRAPVRVPPG